MPKLGICTQNNWLSGEEIWSGYCVGWIISSHSADGRGDKDKGLVREMQFVCEFPTYSFEWFSNELTAVPLLSLNTSWLK